MRRICPLLALLTLLVPTASPAIQLHWASGASTLTFSSARLCTLFVKADSAEVNLPSDWRLLWVLGNCPTLPMLADTDFASATGAQAIAMQPPNTAESVGNTTTAAFHLPGSSTVGSARYVFLLQAAAVGKFKVIAPAPGSADTTGATIQSDSATFNGGVSGDFPAAVLGTTSSHPTTTLTLTAYGKGLGAASSASLVSADTSWRVPLDIIGSTDSTLTLQASVPAQLPDAYLQVALSDGTNASQLARAAADVDTVLVKGNSWLVDPEPDHGVTPKDFAFFYNSVPTGTPGGWRGLFHIIYIRHIDSTGVENSFGHIWSSDLVHWGRNVSAFKVDTANAGAFDHMSVWAPSIVQNGNAYYMFYTGVDTAGNQRTGRVEAQVLDTTDTQWTFVPRQMVFAADSTKWVSRHPFSFGKKDQFRDPYVFPDPDSIGRFLMVYTALDTAFISSHGHTVGFARNRPGTLDRWTDLGRFSATNYAHHTSFWQLESPHVFPDSVPAQRGWRIGFTWGGSDPASRHSSIQFVAAADTAVHMADADTAATHWSSSPTHLFDYLSPDTTVSGWNATEELRAGKVDFLAGYNAWNFNGIHIARMYWNGTNFSLKTPSVTAVDDAGSATVTVRLGLIDYSPRARRVTFEVDLPSAMPVQLVVFDIAGRRVQELLNKTLAKGKSRVSWDTTDRLGSGVRTGFYFAKLTYASGNRVARIPLVR